MLKKIKNSDLFIITEERDIIIPYKDDIPAIHTSCQWGLYEEAKDSNEQADQAEGIAIGVLSHYPRYVQRAHRVVGGSPYDITCDMVCLGLILGIQVKGTGNTNGRITGLYFNSRKMMITEPNFELIHAFFFIHANNTYYLVPMKELKKHPRFVNRYKKKSKILEIPLVDFDKFKFKLGQLPEAFKYVDYWI